MVRDQEYFAQVRLPGAMRNCCEDVGLLADQLHHGLAIAPVISNALLPRRVVRRRWIFGPVIGRPFLFLVTSVDAEVPDVVLRDAQMLENLPERVCGPCRHATARLRR